MTAVKKPAFTKKERNWILYDVANSAYVLLATALLTFYRDFIFPSESLSTVWGRTNAIIAIISVILCPILGTLADFSKKKVFFISFAAIGMAGCGILSIFSLLTKGAVAGILFLIVYIITQVGHSSALVFYDSMLADVTTDENMHKVSSHGYAWGYIGSCIPFILCLVLYVLGDMIIVEKGVLGEVLDKPFLGTAFSLCCLITAVWWIIFTIPLCKSYEQKHFLPKPDKPIRSAFKRLGSLFKELKKHKKAFFFLFAFFFYIDGVHTIITMAMSIGNDLQFENFGAVKLVIALFVTQLVACPFAILFGKLTSKFRCEYMLIVNIVAYFCIGVFAVFLRHEWQFWVMAVGVGMFQGGIQALSRSYFTKIVPADMTGEFFGLYDIFGKSASILGTLLIAELCNVFPLAEATWINIALLPLPTLFLIGLILFLVSMKIPMDKHDSSEE